MLAKASTRVPSWHFELLHLRRWLSIQSATRVYHQVLLQLTCASWDNSCYKLQLASAQTFRVPKLGLYQI